MHKIDIGRPVPQSYEPIRAATRRYQAEAALGNGSTVGTVSCGPRSRNAPRANDPVTYISPPGRRRNAGTTNACLALCCGRSRCANTPHVGGVTPRSMMLSKWPRSIAYGHAGRWCRAMPIAAFTERPPSPRLRAPREDADVVGVLGRYALTTSTGKRRSRFGIAQTPRTQQLLSPIFTVRIC